MNRQKYMYIKFTIVIVTAPRTSAKVYCSAGHCNATDHLFKWPQDKKRREEWTSFVRNKRSGKKGAQWNANTASRLCFRHFTSDCFQNLAMYTTLTESQVR